MLTTNHQYLKQTAAVSYHRSWMATGLCAFFFLTCLINHTAQAQGSRVGMSQPSLSPPSSRLSRNFGRVGGYIGSNQAYSPYQTTPGSVAKAPRNTTQQRRRSRGAPGRSARPRNPYATGTFGQGSSGMRRGRSGLSMRPGISNTLRYRSINAPSAMSNFRRAMLAGKQPLSRVETARRVSGQTTQKNWIQPEVVERITSPSEGTPRRGNRSAINPPGVSLEALVDNYVAARRTTYLSRAWATFADGQYRDTQNMLLLANAASAQDPASKPPIKLALVYAGVAAQQYWQAIESLSWLLKNDPETGEPRDPSVFNQIPNVRSLYGASHGRDYDVHMRLVENFSAQNPDSAAARGLWAVTLWGSGDRANAIFQANRIQSNTSNGSLFSGLAEALKQANQYREPTRKTDLMDLLLPGASESKGPAD